MIDWLTLIIPLPHKHFIGGKTLTLGADGELIYEKNKGKSFEGSAESKMYVASNDESELYIHGNPTKFLQGHNLYGIDDPYRLTQLLLYNFYNNNLITFDKKDIETALDNTQIARIDINYSYALPSNADVDIFLNALHYKGKTRHGKATRKAGTVYFGQNSSRYALKFYNKFGELNTAKESKKIYKHLGIEQINAIYKEAEKLLRAELVLRSLELKEKKINNLKQWKSGEMAKKIYNNYLQRLDINNQVSLTDEVKANLPPAVRSTYYEWYHSLQELIPGESMTSTTFYRHRKKLKEYGIDISIPRDPNIKKTASNVVPFFRILEATPQEIPQEFYDLNLIAL